MGAALAEAALEQGHAVHNISGPVSVEYPSAANITWSIPTNDMLEAVLACLSNYGWTDRRRGTLRLQAMHVSPKRLQSGAPLQLELVETPDIVATAAGKKLPHQWVVGFALETEDRRFPRHRQDATQTLRPDGLERCQRHQL